MWDEADAAFGARSANDSRPTNAASRTFMSTPESQDVSNAFPFRRRLRNPLCGRRKDSVRVLFRGACLLDACDPRRHVELLEREQRLVQERLRLARAVRREQLVGELDARDPDPEPHRELATEAERALEALRCRLPAAHGQPSTHSGELRVVKGAVPNGRLLLPLRQQCVLLFQVVEL